MCMGGGGVWGCFHACMCALALMQEGGGGEYMCVCVKGGDEFEVCVSVCVSSCMHVCTCTDAGGGGGGYMCMCVCV